MKTSIPSYISSLYSREHALLNIYLTNQCNLQCRHCATNSGPLETSFLNVDQEAVAAMRLAITRNHIEGMHISGGEPFLRRGDLRNLAALARETGILMAINSNGFWGTSVPAAVSLLDSMKGITELILSTDEYHAEFLSSSKLIVAARAGLECGLLVSVVSTTPDRNPTAYSAGIEEALSAAGLAGAVKHHYQALGPSARKEPIKEHVQFMSPALPRGRCNRLNRPTVIENGSVLACCNTTIAKKCERSPLNLGRMDEAPLGELLDRAKGNHLLQALRTLGPAILAEALPDELRSSLPKFYPKDDICALCSELMVDEQLVAHLGGELHTGSLKNLLTGALMLRAAPA
ncbi:MULTISPECIES: radical SAM protein [unclassified Duganella]|uniref:radical SAM protein n=1 Tax=unclassified Duganella TaxID=2636909 RepID=UPI000E35744B|nr:MULTISPECIES: radical SAM protein [unclassified Duganella]RFP08142.1 radical SAM protein [Duganella sp. BJB475]RFP36177.1 radical SAM protein [Duganella sp. BJB476]